MNFPNSLDEFPYFNRGIALEVFMQNHLDNLLWKSFALGGVSCKPVWLVCLPAPRSQHSSNTPNINRTGLALLNSTSLSLFHQPTGKRYISHTDSSG